MSATFKGDWGAIENQIEKALNPLSVQIAKDSNKYVMKDTGATESSVWSASKFPDGLIVWDTEYADNAYLVKSALLNHNPMATTQWFLTAKANHLAQWLEFAEQKIKEAM